MSFILTEEHINNAVTYMPILEKEIYAKEIAKLCVFAKTPSKNDTEEFSDSFPYLFREHLPTKMKALLSVFLSFYFNVEIEGEITDSSYDFYASGHIYNTLEKYKAQKNLRNKVFEILSDFKEFKKIVDNEISNLIAENNDTLIRFFHTVKSFIPSESLKVFEKTSKSISEKSRKND